MLMVTLFGAPVHAQKISGAIFTTVADGSEVNFNIYPSKDAVYLNGGPGPGAPEGAAGLPDGTYVFMVTDPSGKTLLSTDPAGCREFVVSGGDTIALGTAACATAHLTGADADGDNSITVQLLPYNDTPNKGGEYKVWATPVQDYLCNTTAGLAAVDCSGGVHGFVHSDSKTDNFKVKVSAVVEIDTRFHDTNNGGAYIDGMGVTWIDTLGASNNKWSYYNLDLDVNHEAHVESPELGTHQIVIPDQIGCTVDDITVAGQKLPNWGPQTVSVKISPSYKNVTIFIDVNCN